MGNVSGKLTGVIAVDSTRTSMSKYILFNLINYVLIRVSSEGKDTCSRLAFPLAITSSSSSAAAALTEHRHNLICKKQIILVIRICISAKDDRAMGVASRASAHQRGNRLRCEIHRRWNERCSTARKHRRVLLERVTSDI